jgi:hypothetical protein
MRWMRHQISLISSKNFFQPIEKTSSDQFKFKDQPMQQQNRSSKKLPKFQLFYTQPFLELH